MLLFVIKQKLISPQNTPQVRQKKIQKLDIE
jgi:hypothetical protein